jgi:hypothetical protein
MTPRRLNKTDMPILPRKLGRIFHERAYQKYFASISTVDFLAEIALQSASLPSSIRRFTEATARMK